MLNFYLGDQFDKRWDLSIFRIYPALRLTIRVLFDLQKCLHTLVFFSSQPVMVLCEKRVRMSFFDIFERQFLSLILLCDVRAINLFFFSTCDLHLDISLFHDGKTFFLSACHMQMHHKWKVECQISREWPWVGICTSISDHLVLLVHYFRSTYRICFGIQVLHLKNKHIDACACVLTPVCNIYFFFFFRFLDLIFTQNTKIGWLFCFTAYQPFSGI